MPFHVNLPLVPEGVITALFVMAELKRFVLYLYMSWKGTQADKDKGFVSYHLQHLLNNPPLKSSGLHPEQKRDNVLSFRVCQSPVSSERVATPFNPRRFSAIIHSRPVTISLLAGSKRTRVSERRTQRKDSSALRCKLRNLLCFADKQKDKKEKRKREEEGMLPLRLLWNSSHSVHY